MANIIPGENASYGYDPSAGYFYYPAGAPTRGDLLGAPRTKGGWIDVEAIGKGLDTGMKRFGGDPTKFMPWYMNTILSDPAYTSEGIYRQYALQNGLQGVEDYYNQLAGATPFGATGDPMSVRRYYNYIGRGMDPSQAQVKAGNSAPWTPPSVTPGQLNPSQAAWQAGQGREADYQAPAQQSAVNQSMRQTGSMPSASMRPTRNQMLRQSKGGASPMGYSIPGR